jgi:hypothetical protein
LKAIIPWEGFADIYRDALFHGGILSVFMTNWFTAHLMHHVMGRAAQHQPTAGRPTRCGTGCTDNLDSGTLRGAQAQWDRITVPMLTVGNWTGFALHLRGNTEAYMRAAVEAQEASHPQRLARASVLHRGGQARSASLLRLLAQGHRQRRDGRAAGQARDPQGQRRDRMAPRARMAARAHAVDQVLFRLSAAAGRSRASALVRSRPRGESLHLSGDQPRHHGLDLGGVLAGDGRRHQARHGRGARDAAAAAGLEITGPLAARFCVERDRGHGLFLTLRNFDADGNEVLETGQQGAPVPVAKGWLRVSHRELDPDCRCRTGRITSTRGGCF